MAWQVGVAQTVPLVCYLDGVSTAPTAPIVTEVNVESAGYVAATNDATIEGDAGEVSVLLTAEEMGEWGFVRVTGANGSQGIQPFTSEGDWTATRAGYTDKLNVPGTLTHTGNVATAPANLADLKITPTTGQVDVGAVAGTAVTGPDDLKANVSTLSTLTEAQVQALLGTLNDLSTADVSALLAALQLHGDGAWVTATGFSTHSAADVTGGRTVAAAEAALRGTGAESLATLATAIDEIEAGTAGGDATLAKQDAILAALTALMGEGWEGESDTLVALAQALAALPAGTLAAIEAAHGTGPYDGIGTPTAQIVSSRVVEAGEHITFYRDSTPQTVTILRAGVDFSEWDCYFTIKPTSALDDADNAAAVCTVEGDGYPGVVRFAVTASHVAALERDRAYHFSAERKRGEEYQLDLMGTCKLVWNVRRDV